MLAKKPTAQETLAWSQATWSKTTEQHGKSQGGVPGEHSVLHLAQGKVTYISPFPKGYLAFY